MKTLPKDIIAGFSTGLFRIPEGMAHSLLVGATMLIVGQLFVIGISPIIARLPNAILIHRVSLGSAASTD